jgi:hypothetical protein
MLKDVVQVTPLNDYRLAARFEDGVEGEIDVCATVRFEGVFAPLADPEFFRQVRVNEELGVICWPNGADLDSDVLYSEVTGAPILSPVPLAQS